MRIALVAFSGVRAFNQELMDLGLTFPGVLERSTQVARLPSLGLLTLAGMTSKEHQVDYLDVQDLDEDNLPSGYDVVALSSLTAQIKTAYRLADRFRALGSKVVLGGLHVTALPEEARPHADAVVIGEGEPVWNTLIDDAAAGELKATYDARETPFDFHNAPMPAFELLDFDRYNRITVQTSRGCPHSCSFCASSILLSKKYKQKPVDKVLEEIDYICKLWRRPFLEFADDNSFVNRKYWDKLLPELEKRKLRWFTETDISIGDDPVFLEQLRRAGCKEVLIGLESDKLEDLAGIEMRNDWKSKQHHTYLERIRRIQAAGIRVNGCFIFGLDGQTTEVFDRVYAFANEAKLFDVQLTLLTAFPGTPLLAQLRAQGRMTHDEQWERFTLFDLNHTPSGMTSEELTEGFKDLVVRMYDPAFQRQRRAGFKFERRRDKTTAITAAPVAAKKRGLPPVLTNDAPKAAPIQRAQESIPVVTAPVEPIVEPKVELPEMNAERASSLKSLAQLKQDLHPLREELLAHPLYERIVDVNSMQTLMSSHVFAVWDFMSLVKRLQQGFTCTTLPWRPAKNPMLARFINDVVLTEESDVGVNGEPTSHLELYVRGMHEVGADTNAFEGFMQSLDAGVVWSTALQTSKASAAVKEFVRTTIALAEEGDLVEVAAVFSCGREDIIPEMFESFLGANERDDETLGHAKQFRYYLERHIHLDAEEHGPMAEEMLIELAGTDRRRWQMATNAAAAALRARLMLWDALLCELPATSDVDEDEVLKDENANAASPTAFPSLRASRAVTASENVIVSSWRDNLDLLACAQKNFLIFEDDAGDIETKSAPRQKRFLTVVNL